MTPRIRSFALCVAALIASVHHATAAPMPLAGELPLSDDDVHALRTRLPIDEFLATLLFVGSARVFEDDASTAQHPVFYVAPVFAADPQQEVIGGQEIAGDALDLLDALDDLLATIEADPREIERYIALLVDYTALGDLLAGSPLLPPQDALAGLLDYAAATNPFAAHVADLPQIIDQALRSLPSSLRTQIIGLVLAGLDSLGVPLTSADRLKAFTAPAQFILIGLTKLRAEVGTLELGVRHATFVSGMSANQRRWLGNYQAVRPDVDIRALPISVLHAQPVSSSIELAGPFPDRVSAPEMIRGVNASTHGVCGALSSCTVLVEYTEIGARSALLSTRGASIMPAEFSGDVSPPAQSVPVTCDLSALRQSLVLPVTSGLVTGREILRATAVPSICHGTGGGVVRLAAATLLDSALRTLLFLPAQQGVSGRRALATGAAAVIDRSTRTGIPLGIASVLSRALEPERFLDALEHMLERRLMPRFPDDLLLGLQLSATSAPAVTTFYFDGLPIACWKRGADGGSYLSACPDTAPQADVQDALASELSARDCAPDADLLDCATAIQAPPPDAQGFLWTTP